MSEADRVRRAARAMVRRAPRSGPAERAGDPAPDATSTAASDGLARARPAALARAADDEDGGLRLHGDERGGDLEEEAGEIIAAVLETTVAPDPYEDAPLARAQALAAMVHGRERSFGLSRFPSEFHALSGAAKLDWLLSLPDPRASLQALPAEEMAFLLDEIGLADGAELLALASAHQLQAAVDLFAWQGDTLDRRALAHLLAVAVAAGPETVDRLLSAQEDGVLAAFLFGHTLVFEGAEEADEHAPEDAETFVAPDGHMVVAVAHDDPALGPVRVIVDSLFRVSVERGRRVLRALRWELPLALEEDLHDHRRRRLADLGMLPHDEATELFAYSDPEALRAACDERLSGTGEVRPSELRPYLYTDDTMVRTDLVLHQAAELPFLGAAAALLPAGEAARVQTALCFCAYRLQTARASYPAETATLRAHARQALATTEMGLRYAARDDVQRAALLLQTEPIEDLFRIGHGLVVRLHHRALALRRRLGAARRVSLLAGADGAIVVGLLRPLPMWPAAPAPEASHADGWHSDDDDDDQDTTAGDDPAWRRGAWATDDQGPPDEEVADRRAADAGFRPFERLDEVDAALAAIKRLGAVVGLLERAADGNLPGTLDALEADLGERMALTDLEALLATAVAWAVLDGSPRLQALDRAAVTRLLAEAMDGPIGGRRVRQDVRDAISRALLLLPDLDDDAAAALATAARAAIERIDSELGGIDPRRSVDLRYVGHSLLVRDDDARATMS